MTRTATLLHLPMVHTAEEMGDYAPIHKLLISMFSAEDEWKFMKKYAFDLYMQARRTLSRLRVDKVFCDSIPAGREAFTLDYLKDIDLPAASGYGLMLDLVRRGSRLVGVEDPGLLKESYSCLDNLDISPLYSTACERDLIIEHELPKALKRGEIGLLMLGGLHSPVFPSWIKVHPLASQEMQKRMIWVIDNLLGTRPAMQAHNMRNHRIY